MNKNRILLGAAACLAVALSVDPSYAQKTLIFNFLPPGKDPAFGKVFKPYMDQVAKASGGSIKIDSFPGGTLGRNLRQQFKMVADGVFDVTWATMRIGGASSWLWLWRSDLSHRRLA